MLTENLDKHSFILGMVTAFSECVAGGCKRLALSPPLSEAEYRDSSGDMYEIIEKHGLIHFHEENLDQPESRRFHWILIAAKQETLDQYQSLRKHGLSPLDSLDAFSALLSYNPSESVHTGYDAWRVLFPRQSS